MYSTMHVFVCLLACSTFNYLKDLCIHAINDELSKSEIDIESLGLFFLVLTKL